MSIVLKSGSFSLLEPSGPVQDCNGIALPFTIILFRDGINQILVGIGRSPMAVPVQFNGRLLISIVGSKIENTFLITFSLFY